MAELRTLWKALDILLLLGDSREKVSVEDIANRLDIPESTTYRLLQTLEKKGFVERESRGSIRLGYNILNLARDTYEKIDRQLSVAAQPVLEQLTEELCETSLLCVRSSLYVTTLVSVPCRERIRFVADEKRLMPIYLGASGRAILAFENDKVYQQVLANLDPAQRELLCSRIDFTRKNGYAVSRAEMDEGSLGVGVPVYGRGHKVCASLAVVSPVYRTKEETIEQVMVPRMLEASRKITGQLVP